MYHYIFILCPWASYQIRKIAGAHAPGMPGTFSPPPRVSDPDMHHRTCVTHVPWCMPGSLTSGFLWSRRRGKTFPVHAQPAILRIWQEAHCSSVLYALFSHISPVLFQEQMKYSSYNEKSDIWSMGCLLYELCTLRPPFTASNQKELASRICTGRFQRIPAIYSEELNDIISYMLVVEVRVHEYGHDIAV